MNDVPETFEHLARVRQRMPRGAAAVLGASQRQARRYRRRRTTALVAAPVVIVATLLALSLSGGGSGSGVEVGPADTGDGPEREEPETTTTPEPERGEHDEAVAEPEDHTDDRADVVVHWSPPGAADTDCSLTEPVARQVQPPGVLAGALGELLQGPNEAEEQAGYTSFFSPTTAQALRSVRIDAGVAYVDFEDLRELIPNASTSCGSAILLGQLNETATQFDTVDEAVYSIRGDIAAFYNWLGLDVPDVARSGDEPSADEATPTSDPTWPGTVEIDDEAGTVTAPGFNEHVASNQPDWATAASQAVEALLALPDERAAGAVVEIERGSAPEGQTRLTVALSDLQDDSVRAVRYDVTFRTAQDGLVRFVEGTWSQQCQPGRGQQSFAAELCI